MVNYQAIPIEGVSALNSQLAGIKWNDGTLFVDFSVMDKPLIARATIRECLIFRVLTDSAVPQLELEDQRGLSEEHLAYSVEGAFFYGHHVPTVFESPVLHYRFVTGPSLVDALSRTDPVIRTLGVSK
ncbi:hypothetical protein ABIA18_000490 [Sinorhizobium fredii]